MRGKIAVSSAVCVFALLFVISARSFAENSATSSGSERLGIGQIVHQENVITHEQLVQAHENFQEMVTQKRDDASAAAAIKKEEFKQKLQEIKDTHKQTVVQSINDKITNFNATITQKLADALDKLQTILDKISSASTQAKADGKDTTALDAAIQNAQTAIDTAKTSVSTQAGKTYTIEISTDSATLRSNVGGTVSQFRQDITATHQSVMNAKLAVLNAAMELAKIGGLGALHATPSGAMNNNASGSARDH